MPWEASILNRTYTEMRFVQWAGHAGWGAYDLFCLQCLFILFCTMLYWKSKCSKNKKFELMLTRRAKAYIAISVQ